MRYKTLSLSLSPLLLLPLLLGVQSANILIIDSMGSPSHHGWMKTLSYALVETGHNVTALSAYVEAPPQNLHYLHLEKVGPALYGGDNNQLDLNKLNQWEFYLAFRHYYDLSDQMARESQGFQQLLDYPRNFTFDLIILDILDTPSLYIFLDKFKDTPVITASALPFPVAAGRVDGVPYPFSYVPSDLMVPITDMDNVLDRLKSFLLLVGTDVYDNIKYIPLIEKELRKIMPRMRPLKELLRLPQLHLVNVNLALEPPQAMMPNVIPVGGLQIKEPTELTKDFADIYSDEKAKGVVIFSLGTNIKAELLGFETIAEVMQTLGKFPKYNFIWKIDLEPLKKEGKVKVPKNVFVRKWLPQNDLLAQERTKLFISHAGGLSSQETIWYGKPMLCIPGFYDQFANCNKLVNAGIAQRVQMEDVGDDEFEDALKEMLTNDSYERKAKKLSQLFQDQPQKPLERALWWVEYMIRHPEMEHLKNHELLEMNFFVKHSFDLAFIVFVVGFIVLWITVKILLCFCWVRGKSKADKMKIQ